MKNFLLWFSVSLIAGFLIIGREIVTWKFLFQAVIIVGVLCFTSGFKN